MRSFGRRELAIAALACALGGCARPAPLPAAPPGDPLETMRTRAAAARTLRARFSAVARVDGEERRATGALLVRQPDAVRLRLVAPFGMTVFDYTRVGTATAVWVPGPAPPGSDLTLFGHLGIDDARAPGRCEFLGHSGAVVMYRCALDHGVVRTLFIESRTATLREVREQDGEHAVVSRRYDDYRQVDGVPLPHRIDLSLVGRQAAVDIRVERYDVNPPLDAAAFLPAPGAQPMPASAP